MYYRIFLLSLLLSLISLAAQAQWPYPEAPKREVRAVWLTTIGGLDWPKNYARTQLSIERQQQELCDLLDKLQAAHINTVLFQTRIRGTVIYPSALEPWDGCLSGIPGRSPGYDALAFAIEECHRRGMELHAWVVTIPLCKATAVRQLGKEALPRRHPELCRQAGDTWMMDPGVPGTADYLAQLCREIVQQYDVDGIHLDYIRYPEKEIPFNDAPTYRKYGNGQTKAAWRRNNITRCVTAIHRAVKEVKPWVRLSCAPVGKHADLPRYSSRGWNARDAVYQDAQQWMREGLMDWLFPMMYFRGDHFYPFVFDWQEAAAGRCVVPGLGIYFLSPHEKDWPLGDVLREVRVTRQAGCAGQAYFRSRFLTDNVKGLYDQLKDLHYPTAAFTPALTWEDSIAPATPAAGNLREKGCRLQIAWQAAADPTPGGRITYNLYRSETYPVNTDDIRLLVCGGIRETHYETEVLPSALRHAYYAVTAMDRYGNESPALQLNHPVLPAPLPQGLLEERNGMLRLPPAETEYLLVTDAAGRHLTVCPYDTMLSTQPYRAGLYQVRTLGRKGVSRRIGFFLKKPE